jgi:hypothetical protein
LKKKIQCQRVNFLDRFSKNTQISNFMKIRPAAAELLYHVDRRTDMAKVRVAFRIFAHAPQKTATLKHEVLLAEGSPFPQHSTHCSGAAEGCPFPQHSAHCSGAAKAVPSRNIARTALGLQR